MKVYKLKGFVRFQRRERIADTVLVEAIWAAERGQVALRCDNCVM